MIFGAFGNSLLSGALAGYLALLAIMKRINETGNGI